MDQSLNDGQEEALRQRIRELERACDQRNQCLHAAAFVLEIIARDRRAGLSDLAFKTLERIQTLEKAP